MRTHYRYIVVSVLPLVLHNRIGIDYGHTGSGLYNYRNRHPPFNMFMPTTSCLNQLSRGKIYCPFRRSNALILIRFVDQTTFHYFTSGIYCKTKYHIKQQSLPWALRYVRQSLQGFLALLSTISPMVPCIGMTHA